MNVMEHEMIEILTALKGLGCVKIKAEFEAEGTRMEELMRLKDVTCAVRLPIVMKIGDRLLFQHGDDNRLREFPKDAGDPIAVHDTGRHHRAR